MLASVAAYETEVRKERQLAGIAKAKAEGKMWGGRRPGTRIKLTGEKEALIGQLHSEGKPVAAIARMVGLTRKTVYNLIRGKRSSMNVQQMSSRSMTAEASSIQESAVTHPHPCALLGSEAISLPCLGA